MAQETASGKDEIAIALDKLIKKYGTTKTSIEEVRKITAEATKKSGETLSEAVRKIREEQ